MLLATFYDSVELRREDKILYARFLSPHTVLSTCRLAGGLREDLDYVYNHQSCEAAGGHCGQARLAVTDPPAYREAVAGRAGLPAASCATLGTAANMRNAAIAEESFRDLTVAAVCTGGVEGNAGRVGDPASVMETETGFERLPRAEAPPPAGTINTMLFISKPLIPGALVRCVMTATEAKTAALQELAVGSRYSEGPATGTGTDQIAVAARRGDEGEYRLTSAGKHNKLGELIGRAVHRAIRETLALQNGLTPASQRSVAACLKRFGGDAEALREGVCRLLEGREAELFAVNFMALDHDPLTAAAAAALAHLRDKTVWGTLPESCWPDAAAQFAAQIAAAASGNFEALPRLRRLLLPHVEAARNSHRDAPAFIELVCRALALGFREKWPKNERQENATENRNTEAQP